MISVAVEAVLCLLLSFVWFSFPILPFPLLSAAHLLAPLSSITGMGRIGKQLAGHMQHFGMKIIYTNRSGPLPPSDDNDSAWQHVSFEDLLKRADVISLNCPLTEETRGLLSAKVSRAPA